MMSIDPAHFPLILRLAMVVVGIMLVVGALRFLLRLAWHLLSLVLTLLIIGGGLWIAWYFLHTISLKGLI